MRNARTLILAVVFTFVVVVARPAGAQGHEVKQAAAVCQNELVAAIVGSATTKTWIPQTRTVDFRLGSLLDIKMTSVFDGNRYQDVSRSLTFGPVTYTDGSKAVRGVCVSYADAVRKFMRGR